MESKNKATALHSDFSSKAQAMVCDFRLLFDRDSITRSSVPSVIQDYIQGTHYLSTKQVASATLLRKAGSASVIEQAELLRSEGFNLQTLESDNLSSGLVSEEYESSGVHDAVQEVFQASRQHYENTRSSTLSGDEPEKTIVIGEAQTPRLMYEDPFLIVAGRIYADVANLAERPQTKVWSGDGLRLQDPLPRRLLGPTWTGKAKNQVRFIDIRDVSVKLHVILNHTHWGRRLVLLVRNPILGEGAEKLSCKKWATTLMSRVKALIRGDADPCWDPETKYSYYGESQHEQRNQKSRAMRLIELLKTVDGMFQQRYFAYPEEYWTWEKFDIFVLTNLAYLIGDEFLDGELTDKASSVITRYTELKKLRKTFKEYSHKERLSDLCDGPDEHKVPQWLRQFLPLYRRVAKTKGMRYTYLIGLLSQTRGCGTPPPLVVLQSKEKFLKTVVSESPKPNATQAQLVRTAITSILNKIPGEAFTGLPTKSRITITTSACWDRTRREGGTIGHIHDLFADGRAGATAPVIDLDTGRYIEDKHLDEFDTPGEYIFWRCLDAVVKTPPELLTHAYLTVVKEPGKGRSVTKARSYLKVVLDLVSKLCAEPLKKGIPSSASGMGASHHGWNFFNSFFTEEMRKEVFSIVERDVTAYVGYEEHDITYKDLYISSTDYQEATDSMPHWIAQMVAVAWMRKCGIPPYLMGIVVRTCYQPRKVFFSGRGFLSKYGGTEPDFGDDIRSVWLRRGVLMGDPLTKIVLHFVNVITREIAVGINDQQWLSLGFSNAATLAGV